MKKLAVHIVEDEIVIAMDMEDILTELGHTVKHSSMSYEEVMKKLPTDDSDLFIIDIQLKGRETGIDLARELDARQIPHIYVSSVRNEEMIKMARKTNALGYVLKPFDLADIFVATQMAIGKLEAEQVQQSVYIKNGKGKVQVMFQDIFYAEADGHYTHIHTAEKVFTLRGNLKSIQSTVLNSSLFKRVHKSFLVNASRIHKMLKSELVLDNGKVIPLGKTLHREDIIH